MILVYNDNGYYSDKYTCKMMDITREAMMGQTVKRFFADLLLLW